MATLEIDGTLFAEKDVNGNVVTVANTSTVTNLDVTTVMTLPKSATDPANPVEGQIYYNTTNSVIKHYDGTKWLNMSYQFSASGGTETTSNGYKYHTFNTSGFLNVTGIGNVDYLIVGGGGNGGSSTGGGGGAGGVIIADNVELVAGNYTITIGAGKTAGYKVQGTGDPTTAFGLTALGGGSGALTEGDSTKYPAYSGGSGGGSTSYGPNYSGSSTLTPGSGTAGQGNMGNYHDTTSLPGGGGGAGSGGLVTINGGDGVQWHDGNYYGGGGGAGATGATSVGGQGGGGGFQTAGSANTGGGGGGDWGHSNNNGASGGSGIVIIRYAI